MSDALRAPRRALALALVSAIVLGGCATEKTASQCPVPDGAKCMSTEDVYAATNANDHVPKPAKTSQKEGSSDPTTVVPTTTVDGATAPAKPRAVASAPAYTPALVPTAYVPNNDGVTQIGVSGTRVVRAPAKVLTIYIAPWQDDQGDLHLSQRVMTEVVGRRWKIPGYSNIATVAPSGSDQGLLPPGTPPPMPTKASAPAVGGATNTVATRVNSQ